MSSTWAAASQMADMLEFVGLPAARRREFCGGAQVVGFVMQQVTSNPDNYRFSLLKAPVSLQREAGQPVGEVQANSKGNTMVG